MKMMVRLLVSRAGVNLSQARGDEIEVDSDEGERMIAAHQCVYLSGDRGTPVTDSDGQAEGESEGETPPPAGDPDNEPPPPADPASSEPPPPTEAPATSKTKS